MSRGIVLSELVVDVGSAVADGGPQDRRVATGVQRVAAGQVERQAEAERPSLRGPPRCPPAPWRGSTGSTGRVGRQGPSRPSSSRAAGAVHRVGDPPVMRAATRRAGRFQREVERCRYGTARPGHATRDAAGIAVLDQGQRHVVAHAEDGVVVDPRVAPEVQQRGQRLRSRCADSFTWTWPGRMPCRPSRRIRSPHAIPDRSPIS